MNQQFIFPNYSFRTKSTSRGTEIWDEARTKWILLTPEELVRQHMVRYLIEGLGFPLGRIAVEYTLKVVGLTKRADIIVFDAQGMPFMLVECKAPQIPVSQATFDQAARYNLTLEVPYLVVTNGMEIFAAEIFIDQKKWEFLKEIPFSK